jgi:hypothetical protein
MDRAFGFAEKSVAAKLSVPEHGWEDGNAGECIQP